MTRGMICSRASGWKKSKRIQKAADEKEEKRNRRKKGEGIKIRPLYMLMPLPGRRGIIYDLHGARAAQGKGR